MTFTNNQTLSNQQYISIWKHLYTQIYILICLLILSVYFVSVLQFKDFADLAIAQLEDKDQETDLNQPFINPKSSFQKTNIEVSYMVDNIKDGDNNKKGNGKEKGKGSENQEDYYGVKGVNKTETEDSSIGLEVYKHKYLDWEQVV